MKQNKILLVNDTISQYGGAESYLYSLEKLLKKNNYETKIIGSKGGVSLNNSFFSRWYSPRYYKLVKDEINIFKPDIVHVQSFARVISPSVLVAAASCKIPIIQTVHDYHYICPKLWMINDTNEIITNHESFINCLFHHQPQKNIVYSTFKSIKVEYHKRFLQKYVNHFICPSRDLANWYSRNFSDKKISFIPHLIDQDIFTYKPLINYDQILYIGRLSKEKGIDLLLNSFASVIKKIPYACLTIAGDGPEKENLIRLCNKLKLEKNTLFTGKVPPDKLNKYYEESTVVVIPSLWIEVGPLVAIETLISGRPIIATDAGGLKDIIQNNITGYLFQRGNINDLATKITNLLSNKSTIQKFSLNSKNNSYIYNKKYHLQKIEALYLKIKQS